MASVSDPPAFTSRVLRLQVGTIMSLPAALGLEPRALCVPGQLSTTQLRRER